MVNLLFDYDGTLHDSLAIYAPAVQAAYDTLVAKGYAAPKTWPRETIRQWIGLTPQEMWDRFQPNLPREEQLARSTQVGEEMLALIGQGRAQLYPGVPQVLDRLKGMGLRLLLLSNCPAAYLQAHKACFGLERWFDGLYCGEEFQYRPKHEILPILRMKWQGTFLVIGDREQDVEMARRNHVPAVGCLYSYGSREELARADQLIQNVEELPALVEKFVRREGTQTS